MSVLEFKRKEPDDPHLSGWAQCIECKHRWAAVAPIGTRELECPACGLNKGRFRNVCMPEQTKEIWQCTCGGDLFVVVKSEGYMCANCGLTQTGF